MLDIYIYIYMIAKLLSCSAKQWQTSEVWFFHHSWVISLLIRVSDLSKWFASKPVGHKTKKLKLVILIQWLNTKQSPTVGIRKFRPPPPPTKKKNRTARVSPNSDGQRPSLTRLLLEGLITAGIRGAHDPWERSIFSVGSLKKAANTYWTMVTYGH